MIFSKLRVLRSKKKWQLVVQAHTISHLWTLMPESLKGGGHSSLKYQNKEIPAATTLSIHSSVQTNATID